MNQKLAQVLSYIFHPMLVTVYAILITMVFPIYHILGMHYTLKIWLLSIILLFCLAIPLLIFYFLKKLGKISSYYMENRSERNLPFVVLIVCYAIATYFVEKIPSIMPLFNVVLVNAVISLFFVLTINSFTKISAHLTALGSLTAYLYFFSYMLKMDLLVWILSSIFISGLIAIARLSLEAHTKFQIYLGFFTGVIVTTTLLFLLFFRG